MADESPNAVVSRASVQSVGPTEAFDDVSPAEAADDVTLSRSIQRISGISSDDHGCRDRPGSD